MSLKKIIGFCTVGMLAVLPLLCSSCRHKRQLDYLQMAREATDAEHFQLAKAYIDSIRIVTPKDYNAIKEGMRLMREIEFAEQKRTREYCDSLLTVRQAEFPEKQKEFTYTQNPALGNTGYYINIRQIHSKNHNRTYLQTKVDDKGHIVLTSYYCGPSPLHHTQIRVYALDDSYAESLPVPQDGAWNYNFEDEGNYYEIVRFNEKHLNGLLDFVLLHENEMLQVELIGENRNKKYVMQAHDQHALAGAVDLSAVLSDITRLLNEIQLSQAKMDYLMERQAAASTRLDSTGL